MNVKLFMTADILCKPTGSTAVWNW